MNPKPRILAIDNQLYFRSFLEGILAEAGYAIQTVDRRAAAIEELQLQGRFDALILDLALPDTDGEALIRELRQRWPEQPVIVVTGVGETPAVVSAMAAGAFDYLLKPIDREALLRTIERAAGGSGEETAADTSTTLETVSKPASSSDLIANEVIALFRHAAARDVAEAWLGELIRATGSTEGVAWAREAAGPKLHRMAIQGPIDPSDEVLEWSEDANALGTNLAAGRALLAHLTVPGDDPRALFVPAVLENQLLGVARLGGWAGELNAEAIELATRWGAAAAHAFASAHQKEMLERNSFVDARTGLATRAFLERVAQTEIRKAHRYGRRLNCICIEFRGDAAIERDPLLKQLVHALSRSLRDTDILAIEDARRFWILVTDTDALGGIVLKRRLADRVRAVLEAEASEASALLGMASYPRDGETLADMQALALRRVEAEENSVVHRLGIKTQSSLAQIGRCLLKEAELMPSKIVAEAAELIIGELSCRPQDRGLLFLAPGVERPVFLGPLSVLGDSDASTDVFLGTDGDTIPSGPAVTALALPPDIPVDTTWIVRFGEAPPYAMVAGPPAPDGNRMVYHSNDAVLVEHMTFRLRAEVGFGVRS